MNHNKLPNQIPLVITEEMSTDVIVEPTLKCFVEKVRKKEWSPQLHDVA